MKIIYCIATTCHSGGMERVLANKANYLAEKGYEVVIITTDQKNRMPFFPLSPRIRCYDLDINYAENNDHGFLDKVLHYPSKQRKHKKRLTKILNDLQADITVSMFCNDVSFIWKIKDGSKKVLEIHFSRFKRLQYGRNGVWKWVDAFRNRTDFWMVGRFDKFVVLTHEDQEYWGDLPNMEIIPNAKNEWGDHVAALENKQVVAVGRYDYQKGFDMLIESWLLVHEHFPEWKLKIIGDGKLRETLKTLINKHHLGAVVELKKSVSNILPEYLEASLLVLSSRYEGLPMVLLEAMSVGLPVVAFECKCGPRDIIAHGTDGLLVPMGNVDGLAVAIMGMLADINLRKKMGQVAKIHSERFSEVAVMRRWMQLFDELVNKNS